MHAFTLPPHAHTLPRSRALRSLLGIGVALFGTGWTVAQTPAPAAPAAPLTRAEVKMERAEFLKTHRWDVRTDTYVLREHVTPPAGMKTRAEIKAERDDFLSKHRWEGENGWVRIAAAPRDVSTVPREQIRAETAQFLKTHRWDEENDRWIERAPRKKRS